MPARIAAGGALPQTALGFPVYDTHGNSVGMVALSGTVGHERTYSPWGEVVSSNGSPPQQGYCANLGHRQDPESALTYMRARYYEPTTGRFITEDPARDGTNWYAYCANEPANHIDPTGRAKKADIKAFEDLVRRLLLEGSISQEYYQLFMDRSTGVRRAIHDAITKQRMSLDEIADLIVDDCRMRSAKGFIGIGIGYTTLDAAFNQDPVFVIELLIDIFSGGRGWDT